MLTDRFLLGFGDEGPAVIVVPIGSSKIISHLVVLFGSVNEPHVKVNDQHPL